MLKCIRHIYVHKYKYEVLLHVVSYGYVSLESKKKRQNAQRIIFSCHCMCYAQARLYSMLIYICNSYHFLNLIKPQMFSKIVNIFYD